MLHFMLLVDILLNAAGNAPIMKQRKWTVDWQKDVNWVCKFIHKYLKLDPEEKLVRKISLFFYVLIDFCFLVSLC